MSRVLIDTQGLIWLAEDASKLSATALALVDDPATIRLTSVASVWEMAIKLQIGKLILKTGSLKEFIERLKANEVEMLSVLADDALVIASLPRVSSHKDPFDRLIAAQCIRFDLTLVSVDAAFDSYGVRRVW